MTSHSLLQINPEIRILLPPPYRHRIVLISRAQVRSIGGTKPTLRRVSDTQRWVCHSWCVSSSVPTTTQISLHQPGLPCSYPLAHPPFRFSSTPPIVPWTACHLPPSQPQNVLAQSRRVFQALLTYFSSRLCCCCKFFEPFVGSNIQMPT